MRVKPSPTRITILLHSHRDYLYTAIARERGRGQHFNSATTASGEKNAKSNLASNATSIPGVGLHVGRASGRHRHHRAADLNSPPCPQPCARERQPHRML